MLTRSELDSLEPECAELVDSLYCKLIRRSVRGSYAVAAKTAELLHEVVRRTNHSSLSRLIRDIRLIGAVLMSSAPQELAVGNIVRRVLAIIRTEETAMLEEGSGEQLVVADRTVIQSQSAMSLSKLLEEEKKHGETEGISASKGMSLSDIRPSILAAVEELMAELASVNNHVADQALEHIHSNEVILTFGRSSTATQFLVQAAKLRQFQVIVAESAPTFCGQQMAIDLAKSNVDTTIITDSAVFAMMARTNKVIIGAHAVLANGGILVRSGGLNIALAASFYSVPLIVVTGLYKICPVFAFSQDTVNDHYSPSEIVSFEHGCKDNLLIQNPAFDYIPPEHVALLVTNEQAHSPSYVYRLLSELYRSEDYHLDT